MRRRDTLLVIAAAVVIALLAWAILASESSDAPDAPPGAAAPAPDPRPAVGTNLQVRP